MLDLESLEAKAKAATPGPWRYGYEPGFCGELIDPIGEMIASFADEPAARDANFIAAANPKAILALIRELREARAAVAAEREAWKPIETAPRDGTVILLGSRGGCWIGKWLQIYGSGYRPENPWSSLMLNHNHMGEKWMQPTHWMPLPQPPRSAHSAKGGE